MISLVKLVLMLVSCIVPLFSADVIISTKECGTSKGCFRSSCKCTQETCEYLVTYKVDSSEKYIQFEVSGKITQGNTPYMTMAIGKSDDMDNLYTIGCFWNGTAMVVQDGYTLTLPHRGHSFITPPNEGVSEIEASLNTRTSIMSCRFSRVRDPGTSKHAKDLRGNKTYHLFAASGKTVHLGSGLGNHHKSKWVTEHAVSFSNYKAACEGVVDANLLIKVHGSLMILAWMAIGAIGMLLAVHYRLTLSHTELLGSRTWLLLHRTLQILATLLTVAGFVVVFVALGELKVGDGIGAAHAIIGLAVLSLPILNIMLAYLRRLAKLNVSARRNISIGHLMIGRCVFVLSATNIVLGLLLNSEQPLDAQLPSAVYMVVAVFGLTILVELVLYCHSRRYRHNRMLLDAATSVDSGSDPLLSNEQSPSITNNRFRIGVLFAYASAAIAAAVLLILGIFEVIEWPIS